MPEDGQLFDDNSCQHIVAYSKLILEPLLSVVIVKICFQTCLLPGQFFPRYNPDNSPVAA